MSWKLLSNVSTVILEMSQPLTARPIIHLKKFSEIRRYDQLKFRFQPGSTTIIIRMLQFHISAYLCIPGVVAGAIPRVQEAGPRALACAVLHSIDLARQP